MRAMLLSFVAVFGVLAGSASTAGAEENSAKHWRGMAVFGVDVMGRLSIALDSNKDGKLDRYWLFVAEQYLPGPWFATAEAEILEKNGLLILRTPDQRYFVGASIKGGRPLKAPKSSAERYVHENGIQLIGVGGFLRDHESFDPMDLASWPPGFEPDDVLSPGTTGTPCSPYMQWYYTQGCDSGGGGATSCSVSGCSIAPTSCSASCHALCPACCTCVITNQDPLQTTARCKCFGNV
jgi:hypothetical protein